MYIEAMKAISTAARLSSALRSAGGGPADHVIVNVFSTLLLK